MMEASREIGIARRMMKVERHLPRNMNTTRATTRKVIKMVSFNELMELMMLRELSFTTWILISEGRVFSIWAIIFFTFLMTFTVLAPDCFWMTICAPCTPLV